MEELRSLRDEVNAILIRSNWEQILYSYVRETDFSPPILLVKMRLAPLLNVCCLHPVWPICTQSAIRERRIRWLLCGPGQIWFQCYRGSDRRADDKTNASALILGNSGQGKTYLLRLLLCNVLEAGKCAISLDSEHEMEDLCRNLGGCFLDFMDGRHRINLLEPRRWMMVVS